MLFARRSAPVLFALVLSACPEMLPEPPKREPQSDPEPPSVPAQVPDQAVEFVLHVGESTIDVGAAPLIVNGTTFALSKRPRWVALGHGYAFEHDSSLSVAMDEGLASVSVDSALLTITPLDPSLSDEQAIERLRSIYVDTGQVLGEPTQSQLPLAEQVAPGRTLATTGGMEVSVYTAKLGDMRIGITLYKQQAGADLSRLRAVAATIRGGTVEPTPHFDLDVEGNSIPLRLGQPAEVSVGGKPTRVVVEAREQVLRTFHGVTFEHPAQATVRSIPNPLLDVIVVQHEDVIVQIIPSPGLTRVELGAALLGGAPAKRMGQVERNTAAGPVKGDLYELTMGSPVLTEVFLFTVEHRTFAMMIQYTSDVQEKASAFASTIVATVH